MNASSLVAFAIIVCAGFLLLKGGQKVLSGLMLVAIACALLFIASRFGFLSTAPSLKVTKEEVQRASSNTKDAAAGVFTFSKEALSTLLP